MRRVRGRCRRTGIPLLDRRHRPRAGHGQALVEFALVFPLFLMLTFFLVEFAFVFSALLGVNYASRNGALTAAEAGDDPLADCVILDAVEQSIGAPGDRSKITTVTIYPIRPDRHDAPRDVDVHPRRHDHLRQKGRPR